MALPRMIADSANVDNPGTGGNYTRNEILTPTSGAGTQATFTVRDLVTRAVEIVSGGTGYANGDTLTFSGEGWDSSLVLTVTGNAAGVITSVEITNPGLYDIEEQPESPTPASVTSGAGENATFNISFGVATVEVATGGFYSGLPDSPAATVISAGGGQGVTLVISYYLGGTVVNVPGSGYTTTEGLTVTTDPEIAGIQFEVSLSESGIDFESIPGLKAVAMLPDELDFNSGVIVRQVSSRRFIVNTGEKQAACKLVTKELEPGELLMWAVDSAGGTYVVSKISSRRVTLQSVDGTQFESGSTVAWSTDAAILNQRVQLVGLSPA